MIPLRSSNHCTRVSRTAGLYLTGEAGRRSRPFSQPGTQDDVIPFTHRHMVGWGHCREGVGADCWQGWTALRHWPIERYEQGSKGVTYSESLQNRNRATFAVILLTLVSLVSRSDPNSFEVHERNQKEIQKNCTRGFDSVTWSQMPIYRIVQGDGGNVRYSRTWMKGRPVFRVRLSVDGTEKDWSVIKYIPLTTREKCTSQRPVTPGGPLVEFHNGHSFHRSLFFLRVCKNPTFIHFSH